LKNQSTFNPTRWEACLIDALRQAGRRIAFHGEHGLTIHHPIRICDHHEPINDMLGTLLRMASLEYPDRLR